MNITIIYNPNSTGDSQANAEATQKQLSPRHNVDLVATESKNHAEDIAREITLKGQPHMIISSSGDGGYHEVVNGVMSVEPNQHIILGLLPSGNANDHYHSLHHNSLSERINWYDADSIDLIRVTTPSFTRYAHSYVGLGLTAKVSDQLNRTQLNPVKELWIVLRQLFRRSPVKVIFENRQLSFDSLIFSNIGSMSKVLSLNTIASPSDGKFEITTTPSGSLIQLLGQMLQAAVSGLGGQRQSDNVKLKLRRSSPIQLDGEVYHLQAGDSVLIESAKQAISCII